MNNFPKLLKPLSLRKPQDKKTSSKKAIIFDASTLISFAMNGLYQEFIELKKNFKGHFLITKDVKREVIDKPLTIKRFELEGMKIKQLLEEGILEMPSLFVSDSEISKETKKIMDVANNTYISKGKEIKLIDLGEASCIALSNLLTYRKIKNVVAIDERTIRLLYENPDALKKYLERKMHLDIYVKKRNFNLLKKGSKIIRSAELIYIAYKKGLLKNKDKRFLKAIIYALKFKGCSISYEEIDKIKKMA